MARNYVCVKCGRSMPMKEYNYKINKRYICPSCVRQLKAEEKRAKAIERKQRTGMKQTYLSMFMKIFFGAMIILISIDGILYSLFGYSLPMFESSNHEMNVFESLFIFILGIALLLWGVVPYLNRKKFRLK